MAIVTVQEEPSLRQANVSIGEYREPAHVGEVPTAECRSVASVLEMVGDRWSVLVIMVLGGGRMRFSDVKRTISGISQRMLTLTLRNLERDGLVTRTIFPTIPPKVDYELTELGRSLSVPVDALGHWAKANLAQIEMARSRFDRRNQAS